VNSVVRVVGEELDRRIQTSLRPLRSARFDLSVYFGRNTAKRYTSLARGLFDHFQIPFLRARFERDDRGVWSLVSVKAVPASEVPDAHRSFVIEAARRFFKRSHHGVRPRRWRYDMAILWTDQDPMAPSGETAIRKFIAAAERQGIRAETIGPEDFASLEMYDALFIRETTAVGHHTQRFAITAAAAGLVVIDDPESIVRCTNKVYQAELFRRNSIPTPPTFVVHAGNRDRVESEVGLPCVLKDPCGAFSEGVTRVGTLDELEQGLDALLAESELVITQAWTPTDFDWRIGVLAGRALFASRYHMARGHWQIVHNAGAAGTRFGRVEAVSLDAVPAEVLDTALRAAALIGHSLYGVDLKALADGQVLVTEVNDNPNIDSGCEDAVLGSALYDAIMEHFALSLDARSRPA
jgi:glutathione synthase/RimK-type ligase-like ATP-grasp enzyme